MWWLYVLAIFALLLACCWGRHTPSWRSRVFLAIIKNRIAAMKARTNDDVVLSRQLLDQAALPLPWIGVRVESATVGGCTGEWLLPQTTDCDATSGAVLLYLHGGGYVRGSLKTHRALAARLARASQCRTFVLDYRLAPEHPFPAALDDAYACYCALSELGPTAVSGDSAGGGLATALALRIRDAPASCETPVPPAPAALALLSPWVDLTLSESTWVTLSPVDPFFPTSTELESTALRYAATTPRTHPWVSPVFARLHNMPPTLVHVGEFETLLGEARTLVRKMTEAGSMATLVEFTGQWHVWQIMGGFMPEADASIHGVGQFLQTHLGSPDQPPAVGASKVAKRA